jgi:ferritin-like metal-binding protein YciE
MAFEDQDRNKFRRSRSNAEQDLRRGTIFDRSRRQRGNYDLPQNDYERESWAYDYDVSFEDEGFSSIDSGLMGQRRQTEWWRQSGPFVGIGPKGYQRSDQHILEEVCERLMQHGRINAEEIEVDVKQGEVVLDGEVEDRMSKHHAEEAVAGIYGVEDIHNRLRVKQHSHKQRGRGQAALPGISKTQMGQAGFQGQDFEQELRYQDVTQKLNTLEDLFFEELKEVYDAEKQLLQALPKLEKAAHSEDLKRGFRQHKEQTERQVERLEQIFQEHERRAEAKRCVGMLGIIMEGEQLMNARNINQDVLDAGLIMAAQKVEHYEISTYGTLRTYAQQLGFGKAAILLDDILNEESKTNEKLTSMAVGHINFEAKK